MTVGPHSCSNFITVLGSFLVFSTVYHELVCVCVCLCMCVCAGVFAGGKVSSCGGGLGFSV